MNYEEILQTVRGFCAREKLLDGKKHLALAVSGGADSMALLCLMRPLAEEKGIALTVCHVNHGLRGETADRDEAFVREVCARLGLPLRVFHAAELEAEAGKPRAGEDWARRLRYACFERVLADGIDAVATAHTGSDQAETLLFLTLFQLLTAIQLILGGCDPALELTAFGGVTRPRRCCSGWPEAPASTARRASGPAARAICGLCSA